MLQQVLTWAIVGVAAFLVLRHVWAEVRGFIRPEDAGCPGCGGCDAAKAEQERGIRPAPQIKMTPLVTVKTGKGELPPHLQALVKKRDTDPS